MVVPSSLLRDRVLMPTLDARAENLRQARLAHNPSPEIDSMAEHIAAAALTATPGQLVHLRAVARLLGELLESNAREGGHQLSVSGVVDRLAADLRRHETTARTSFGVQQLARALRKPLETIVNARGAGSQKYVTAVRQVEDVLRMVPATHLLDNVSLRHELGLAKYEALTRFIQERS
jgi:hypothetical protein